MDEARGNILLVDDDPELLRAHERILARAGFIVHRAENGREARDTFYRCTFDAIITDIAMPTMSGIELLRSVRAVDLTVPVVLVTAQPAAETAIEALDLGALQYLVKPVPSDKLAHAASRAVRLHKAIRERVDATSTNGIPLDRAGTEVCFQRACAAMWMAYQPVVEPATRRVLGHEALLRTNEPSLPLATAFLRAAERLGRVAELGRLVRTQVAHQLASDAGEGTVFVNVHPDELLDDDLYARNAPLARHARRVVLEITERTALDRVPDVRARMRRLRALGYRIALDDLGTGYSGLGAFAEIEPDIIKLDTSLIADVANDVLRQKIVRGLVTLAHDANILVIAEGVARVEERDCLLELGCNVHQGYLYGRPRRERATPEWP